MKIVCDNCATKYSIADEKVRGKVFKIRCKKCSHIIVVRGGDGAGAPMEAGGGDAGFPGDDGQTVAARGGGAPAPLGAGEAVWHLVVDREQIGPLTIAEVKAKFAAGEVDVETYAWREGFADWLRLGSIEDFRDLNASAPQAAAHAPHSPQPEEGATRRTDTADLFASSSSADDEGGGASDLFGGGAPAQAQAPMAAAPAQAESFSSGGGANLFGAPDEAPAPAARASRTSSPGFAQPASSGANGGGAAAASSDGGRMTGQRNENSVLFSLNNLQALASGGGGAQGASKPGVDSRPGFANSQTEGSGLIDIRAMAASTLAAGPSSSGGRAEDPVSFSAAPIFSPMAAPILMPAAPSGPPTWMYAILGVGVLAVLGIVVVGILLLTRKPEPPLLAAAVPLTGAATNPAGAAPSTAGTAAPAPVGTAGTAVAPEPKAGEPTKVATTAPAEGDRVKKPHLTKAERAVAAKGTKVAKADSPPVAASAPAPEAAPVRKKGKGDALDDLLNGASPDKPAPAARRAPREEAAPAGGDDNLPEQLGKSDIVGGMGKIKPRVFGCYDQFKVPGTVNVNVTIGKSGRVSNASVNGAFAGTPTGSCVEKAAKAASFPAFKGQAMTLTYPFILR